MNELSVEFRHFFRCQAVMASDGRQDRTARLWTVETGDCAAKLEGHTAPVPGIAWIRLAPPKSAKLAVSKT